MINQNDKLQQANRIQTRIILILLALLGYMAYRYGQFPKQITVYTAPDITKSFVQDGDDVPLQTVYGFSRTVWETVNFCQEDCKKDYAENLNKYRTFFTDRCFAQLQEHSTVRADLYTGRKRMLLPTEQAMFSTENIKKADEGLWFTSLEYHLQERVKDLMTREQIIQYPIKVIKDQSPTMYNPWGLKIDCFFTDPVIVKNFLLDEIVEEQGN